MDVYLVPDVRRNLLPISCLRNDYKIVFNNGVVQITAYKGHYIAISMYHDGLYSIMQHHDPVHEANISNAHRQNPLMWPFRLGHVGFWTLTKLAPLGKFGLLAKTALEYFKLCVGSCGIFLY